MTPGKEEGYMSSGVTILAGWVDCTRPCLEVS